MITRFVYTDEANSHTAYSSKTRCTMCDIVFDLILKKVSYKFINEPNKTTQCRLFSQDKDSTLHNFQQLL